VRGDRLTDDASAREARAPLVRSDVHIGMVPNSSERSNWCRAEWPTRSAESFGARVAFSFHGIDRDDLWVRRCSRRSSWKSWFRRYRGVSLFVVVAFRVSRFAYEDCHR
jgi:hypothetical protein